MYKSVTTCSLLLAFGAISLGWSAPNQQKKDAPTATKAVADDHTRVAQLRAKLAKPITLGSGIEPNTALKDALASLSEQADVNILINPTAFKVHLNVDAVEDSAVKLPKMIEVRFSTVLRKLLSQVQGTYLIHPDHIEITTHFAATPEVWTVEANRNPLVPQVVDVDFDRRPLEEALKELATQSGINVVLDPRARESIKTPITATMDNVPLDTAVRLIADMAGLKTRAMDNVIYVTSPENVEALMSEDDQQMDENRPKRRFTSSTGVAGMQ